MYLLLKLNFGDLLFHHISISLQELGIAADEVSKKVFTSWSLLRTKLKLPLDAKLPYVAVGDLEAPNGRSELTVPIPLTLEETVGVTLEAMSSEGAIVGENCSGEDDYREKNIHHKSPSPILFVFDLCVQVN